MNKVWIALLVLGLAFGFAYAKNKPVDSVDGCSMVVSEDGSVWFIQNDTDDLTKLDKFNEKENVTVKKQGKLIFQDLGNNTQEINIYIAE